MNAAAHGSGPYSGIRILDLSRVLAGPYATLVLADLGAEVIKVENSDGGDDSRQFKPPSVGDTSAYFLAMNRNKKSIAIDLKRTEGREVFLRMAANCDVVVENFRSGVVERLGIDYPAVKAVNPAVIYCSISGYGRTGSHARVPGYDPVAQAECGLMSMNGEADGPPTRSGASHVDMVTGLFAAQAISAALWHRRETSPDTGQRIEVCLFDTALNMLLNYGASHLMLNDEPSRSGSGSPVAQPSGTYSAQDGDLMLTVGSERVFQAFCNDVLERPDIATDSRFKNNPDRIAHTVELDQVLNEALGARPRNYWLTRLRQAGVPSAPINSVREALDHDLVAERDLVQTVEHLTLGRLPSLASPMRLEQTPVQPPRAAPLLGQHSEALLAELADLDGEAIASLLAGGAVRSA